MLFYRVASSKPERVFVLAKNSSADILESGWWVTWDYLNDLDGVSVDTPSAKGAAGIGRGISMAGVAAHTIAVGAYGLIQIYGYHPEARVIAVAGADIGEGTALGAYSIGGFYMAAPVEVSGTRANMYPVGFSFSTYTDATNSGTIGVFVKCI